jgi:Zn-finger nucleic acid-binding protein
MDLTCPKCQAPMRSYERNGVTVDQCGDCRGIFLDRGELERLVEAENSWHRDDRRPAPGYDRPPAPASGGQAGYGSAPTYGGQPGHGYGKPHKRRKSFLEELFD